MEEFKPYDRVLVRNSIKCAWKPDFYGYQDQTSGLYYGVREGGYSFCIPYEGNENLIGTKIEPWKPKNGDFVTYTFNIGCNKHKVIMIYKYIDEYTAFNYVSYSSHDKRVMGCENPQNQRLCTVKDLVKATDSEKQLLISKLAEIGKKWNSEKKCIEYIWKPKDGDFVFIKFEYDDSSRGCFVYIQKGNNGSWKDNYVYSPIPEGFLLFNKDRFFNATVLEFRPATESEKGILLKSLHKENKDWSKTEKKFIPYIWEPVEGESCWYIDSSLKVREIIYNPRQHKFIIQSGNRFNSPTKANKALDKIIKLLKTE